MNITSTTYLFKHKTAMLFSLLILFCTADLAGQSTNGTSADWNSTATWSGGVVPGNNSGTLAAPVKVNHALTFQTNNTAGNKDLAIKDGVYEFYKNVVSSGNLSIGATGYSATKGILDIKSGSTTTFQGTTYINNTTLYIRSGATLILGVANADPNYRNTNTVLTVDNSSKIYVEDGGTLLIYGSFRDNNNGKNGVVSVAGFVQIYGDYVSTLGNIQIDAAGTNPVFNTTGSITTNSTSSTVFGSTNNCTTGPCSGTALGGTGCGNAANGSAWSATITSAIGTLCAGQSTALSFTTDATLTTSVTYQWQSSTTGAGFGFTNMTGQTAASLSVTPVVNTWYRMAYTASGCTTAPLYSPATLISVTALPSVASQPAAIAQTLCLNGPAAPLSLSLSPGNNGTVSYQWYRNTTPSTSGSSLVATSTSAATTASFTPATAQAGTFYYYAVVTNGNGCAARSNFSGAITVGTTNAWKTSATSSVWSEGSNWGCGGKPALTHDVIIPAGATTYPVLLSNETASVNNLTVEDGASFGLGTASTLTIAGNLAIKATATWQAATGAIVLNGAGAQNIDVKGASLYALRIAKTAGEVVITSPMKVLHILDIQSVTTVQSNGNITITSRGATTNLDASIGVIPTGAAIVGSVNVQRYMQAVGTTYRYLSSPVAGALPSTQMNDNFAVKSGSLFQYQEPTVGVSNNGYVNIALTSPLQTGRGYLAWMYNGTSNITWDVQGTIHQGSIALPVSFTSTTGGANNDGWNLVGNPYPSAIQWNGDAKAWTRSADISPVVYVTDKKDNVFRLYNHLDNSGDLTAGVIAMGQAFWVKAGSTTAAITIHEQAKSTNANGKFYRSAFEPSKQATVSLSYEGVTDVAYLKSNRQATPGFDEALDAHKLKNTNINVYFMDAANLELAMHTLAEVKHDDIIRLGIEGQEPGTYQLSFAGLTNLHEGAWYLIDRLEGVSVPVSEEVPYEFVVTTPSKTIHERFALSRTSPELKESFTALVDAYPNPVLDVLQIRVPAAAPSRITLLDTMGAPLWTGEGSSLQRLDMQSYASGIYMLRIEYQGQTETRKIIKK